jgi:hypothetical protein
MVTQAAGKAAVDQVAAVAKAAAAEPLSAHIDRVSETVHSAVSDATRTASTIIEQSVQLAHAAIGAAANS